MKDKIYVNKIKDVMNSAMENIRPLIDVDVVIGKTIEKDGVSIIPLSKVTMGFVSGGGEYYSEIKEMRRETEYPFSGGSGGGVSLQPIGFLIIKQGSVEVVKIDSKSAVEKLIETIPDIAKFVGNAISGNKEDEEK
ncbi:MAG: GerW family sporulation protein [Clostridia bacterium]|nr:GerW family sporulation protein [Clostridia bacterium]